MHYKNKNFKDVVVEIISFDGEEYHLKVISGNIKNAISIGQKFSLSKDIFENYYSPIIVDKTVETKKIKYVYFYHGTLIQHGLKEVEFRGIYKSDCKIDNFSSLKELEKSILSNLKTEYGDNYVYNNFLVDNLTFLHEIEVEE